MFVWSHDLFFTVNFQWRIQIAHKGRGGGRSGIENGSELNKKFFPSLASFSLPDKERGGGRFPRFLVIWGWMVICSWKFEA